MSGFAAWGLSILGLAVITTVAEMFLPKGKTKKAIRSVFAVVMALAVITPLPKLLQSMGFSVDEQTVNTDESYLAYVENAKNQVIVDAAKKHLKANGYTDGFTVKIETEGYKVQSATVVFSQNGINGGDEHINKSEIIGLLADFFDIPKEAIMSYG